MCSAAAARGVLGYHRDCARSCMQRTESTDLTSANNPGMGSSVFLKPRKIMLNFAEGHSGTACITGDPTRNLEDSGVASAKFPCFLRLSCKAR